MRTVGFDTSLYILSPIIGFVSDETIRVERRPDGGAVPRWSLGSAKMRGLLSLILLCSVGVSVCDAQRSPERRWKVPNSSILLLVRNDCSEWGSPNGTREPAPRLVLARSQIEVPRNVSPRRPSDAQHDHCERRSVPQRIAFSGISLPQNLQGAIWSLARRFCVARSSARRCGASFSSSNPQFVQAEAVASYGVRHSGQRIIDCQ